jgi:hypothetical protein
VFERQVIFQTIDKVAENKPDLSTADECLYIYIHGDGAKSPKIELHRKPGPVQVFLPLPNLPSPGSKTSLYGIAVVVAVTGPAGVGTHAVTDFGCHIDALTQNQVPMLIKP